MGRTLLPFRPALDVELRSWNDYRRGLRIDDRPIFDTLANYARIHADAGSLAARPLLSEVIFMSVAIEQQKLLGELHHRLQEVETKLAHLSPISP